jgi:hypothetical protein
VIELGIVVRLDIFIHFIQWFPFAVSLLVLKFVCSRDGESANGEIWVTSTASVPRSNESYLTDSTHQYTQHT